VTWDPREGFDKLRWSDRLETARALYPEAGQRRARRGVNPQTGEPLVQAAGLTIRDPDFFPVAPTGLALGGSVGFDEMGVTDLSITCFGSADDSDDHAVGDLGKTMLEWLEAAGRRLGFGPVHEVVRQSWTLPTVTVHLALEHDGFRLEFTPRREG
jgi:hypothetical protein